MDPDADPSIFIIIIDLQDANNKKIKNKSFPAYYLLRVLLHHFSKIKKPKRSLKRVKIKAFLTKFA
jgi:hypothetical protein